MLVTMTEVGREVATQACTCSECGLTYWVPARWREARQRDHRTFYCPNGCGQHFPGETPEERRIRELEAERARLDRLAKQTEADYRLERDARLQAQRSLSATRGVLTRTRNRLAAGVCPCCHRTFKQLARHMAAKHPDYREEAARDGDDAG